MQAESRSMGPHLPDHHSLSHSVVRPTPAARGVKSARRRVSRFYGFGLTPIKLPRSVTYPLRPHLSPLAAAASQLDRINRSEE
jgi:hypothetical protein